MPYKAAGGTHFGEIDPEDLPDMPDVGSVDIGRLDGGIGLEFCY
jgi:hypothetical protein